MNSGNRRITLLDIARSLGVSRGTVDRAIHGRGRINAETRERVIEEARRLGYGEERLSPLLALRKSLDIIFIVPDHPAYFFDAILEGAREAARGLSEPGVGLTVMRTPAGDEGFQAALMREVPDSADGIILIPRGMEEIGAAAAAWKGRPENGGKPLITVNSDLPDCGRDCFIGQDLYRSGRLAGELLGKFVREGRVLPLTGKLGLFGHEERLRGFGDVIRGFFPGIEISDPLECLDDEERAARIVLGALESAAPPGGIFCATGAATAGAAEALRRKGRTSIPLVGYDRSPRLEKELRELVVDALVTQDPAAQGREAVLALHAIASGERPPAGGHIHTGTEILFSELCG